MFRKIVCALFLSLLTLTFFVSFRAAGQAESLEKEVLRLHIVAASDAPSDQALKLKVRDALLRWGKDTLPAADKQKAMQTAMENREELEAVAAAVLKENGSDAPVTVSLSRAWFPTKEYENGMRLPAGEYDALRVTIGEGAGQNWWCVLYPPLCFGGSITESEQALTALAGDAAELAVSRQPRYEIRFKLAEIWQTLIRR